MRRILSISLVLLLTTLYYWVLNRPVNTSQGALPPPGSFVNPFSGFWKNAEASIPSMPDLNGLDLKEPVEVIFDDRLVPHIFAANKEDLLFVEGYLHARNRLWQMDITARQASGRLTEVFGEGLLEQDRRMRKMGMTWAAEKHLDLWKECSEYHLLEKYVAGINAYIDRLSPADYPLEFKLFDYHPEPWTPYHTVLVMMSMNLELCGRNEDIAATNTLLALGQSSFSELYPAWNPRQSPIIPTPERWESGVTIKVSEERSIPRQSIGHHFQQPAPPSVGSNNWAVSAEKTASGNPILCNDPHLNLSLPSIWYEMQTQTPTQNAYGVSLPGIPNIIIGFNEHVAWGQTNVGMDVSDFFSITWADEKKETYMLDGKTQPVNYRFETYMLKGGEKIIDTIRYTFWGPVMYDDSLSLALKWLPHNPSEACIIRTFDLLNSAENYEDYLEAIANFSSPAQNYVFASRQGDIALRVQGKLPIKSNADAGRFIYPGNTTDSDWSGYIPQSNNPAVKNPARGFIASANQHSTDTTYPYAYHGYFDDFRGRSLNARLDSMSRVMPTDMQQLQLSTYSLLAAELAPLLLGLLDSTADHKWFKEISNWNYHYDSKAIAPIFFEKWVDLYTTYTWDELSSLEQQQDILYPEMWRLITLTDEEPDHSYFDIRKTPEREMAGDLAMTSFNEAVVYSDSIFEENPQIDWGTYKQVGIRHLSRIPAFSKLGVYTGGVADALNSIKRFHGPSWRMVVELGERVTGWGIYPGGQSGNPGSHFYQSMIEDWAQGQYYTLTLARQPTELQGKSIHQQIFSP